MKKNVFSTLSAQAALALAASLLIGLSSCEKEKSGSKPDPVGGGSVTMTTEKAVGDEITLWFAIGDAPVVKGADETEFKEEDGWLQKKYQLKAQNLVIKGKVTKLVCSSNSLASLDVSRNTGLTELICHYNSLTSLDVSKNTELTVLYCSNNSLASLDVRNNTKLKELFCHNNSLNGESLKLPALATKGILYFKYGAEDAQMLTEDEVKDIRDNKHWAVKTHDSGDWHDYEGEERAIAMTTEEAVGGEIELWFAPGDEPSVDGAKEIETKVEEGWLQKKYQLKAQNLVIKGKVTKLVCSYNSLTSLDVSKNTTLEILDCSYNNSLTSLDVSKNTTLEILDCSGNPLSSLDVSRNTKLTYLDCTNTSLTSLDVSKNTELTALICSINSLSSLDVSRNTKLTALGCSINSLSSLDVSRNTKLTVLDCSNNSLASLDVSNNTKLKELFCYNNSLNGESLELPALATKGILYFKYGAKDAQMLTEDEVKDIRDNKNWAVRMYVDKNWVEYKGERAIAMTTEEAVGGEIYLKFAPGDEPSVEGAEEKESEERNGWLKKKYQLKAQNLVIKGKVTKLGCSDNKLTSLDVSKNTTLEILDCSYNSLTSLDVSKNTTLEILDCSGNPLSSLDVSKNTELTELGCSYNSLTSLDVSGNTGLTKLNCSCNSLTSLDVSGNTGLTVLYCSYNSLTSLDVSKNTELTVLYCYKNNLTFKELKLPKLSAEGSLYFKYTVGGDSQTLTTAEVKEIKENKNWTVWQYKGKKWVPYPGE